ncbi:hypothetical protein V8E54_010678 [Elaphomyces granulatus]
MEILSESDKAKIQEWNAVTPVAVESCVHWEIQLQFLNIPEAPAICSWDGEATYSRLDELSLYLARHLCRLGVGLESIVAVSFEKSVWAVVAMLAVLRAGAAFVSLDPLSPKSRWESIMNEVKAETVLVSHSTSKVFIDSGRKLVVVSASTMRHLEEDKSHCPVLPEVRPHNAAFVLFTSGSTGRPKGLIQDHRAVCTMNDAYTDALHMNNSSRVFQFAAYTFDASTVDIFHTLMHGGCVCIPSEHDRMNDIVRSINELGADWANLTPSLAATLSPGDVPGLKTLILAGEEVRQTVLRRWVGKVRLINCYGPAEAGACAANEYKSPEDRAAVIGRPIRRFACWVVAIDCIDRLAPIGAIGELLVEGPSLARGYINNTQKTQESFINNPAWYPLDNLSRRSRFYRTGDLVAYRPDGSLEFIGRRDSQVKVRGQRVEVSEVEMHLAQHDSIYRCVVAFPGSGPYSKQLVAVVQPAQPLPRHAADTKPIVISRTLGFGKAEGLSLSDIVAYLRSQVPAYMVPTSWILVENIPVSPSFKIDRKSVCRWLEELPVDYLSIDCGNIPEIPLDNTIAYIISHRAAKLLSKGIEDLEQALRGKNFVLSAFGMDSIQAMSLARWIGTEFSATVGVELLTSKDLTVADLATEVARKLNGTNGNEVQLDLMSEVRALSEGLPRQISTHAGGQVQNIFLTGATGFLGMRILRKCLTQPGIHKVVAHVRARSATEGRERIVREAKQRCWWSESFESALEVWVGDLELPRLGLSEEQWDRVRGKNGPSGFAIDSIVHNGAKVVWNTDYCGVKKANTISTVQLLTAMTLSTSCHRFVYVSGGQRLSFEPQDEKVLAAEMASATGYGKSKLISELLVKNFSAGHEYSGQTFRIVKPSYIIGSRDDGRSPTRDYIWMLIAGAIEIQAYNVDEDEYWLFLSDVDYVATVVLENATRDRSGYCTSESILDGIKMKDLWNILVDEFGYRFRPLSAEEWWKKMRENVEEKGESHCLWPLLDMLVEGRGNICSPENIVNAADVNLPRIKAAIRMNIRYLLQIGFFHPNKTAEYNEKLSS